MLRGWLLSIGTLSRFSSWGMLPSMLLVARPASQQPGRKRGIEGSKQYSYSCIEDLNGSLQVKATRIFRWLVYYHIPSYIWYPLTLTVNLARLPKCRYHKQKGRVVLYMALEERVEKQQHHGREALQSSLSYLVLD